MNTQNNLSSLKIIFAIIFSGFCWYFSLGLSGNFWYLLWIAPIPVLIISFQSPKRLAFFVSFLAYFIGKLSWFSYLVTVATLIPAIIFTIALPLIFSIIVLISRTVFLKTNAWFGLFAFPVFFTFFEFLLINLSPDGSAASIAYSQSNFLPFIQIASLTGILGITFFVSLIPSATALCWLLRDNRKLALRLTIVSFVLIASIILFGIIRINSFTEGNKILVGMAVLNENTHKMGNLNFQEELQHTINYSNEIARLAEKGAKIILLPERAININSENKDESIRILSDVARTYNIAIIVGYTNFIQTEPRNSALVINQQGNSILNYDKSHLVTGLEQQFKPGNEIGLFNYDETLIGVAICKDLDFPDFIGKYGNNNLSVIFVPAWDFVIDDWLHSRMAIMRGIENGFSEVRVARQGRLTISNYLGRTTAEADASNNLSNSLVGKVSFENKPTFYSQFGEIFGKIISFIALIFLLAAFINVRKPSIMDINR